MDVPTSGCRIWQFWMSAWQPTSQLFGIAVCTLRVTFILFFVVCHFFTAIVMTSFASGMRKSGPLMLMCINKLSNLFSRESRSLVFILFTVLAPRLATHYLEACKGLPLQSVQWLAWVLCKLSYQGELINKFLLKLHSLHLIWRSACGT